MSMIEKFSALADRIEAQAAGIRRRANSGASAASQRIMASEAAALERSARAIRKQIEEAMADDGPDPGDIETAEQAELAAFDTHNFNASL